MNDEKKRDNFKKKDNLISTTTTTTKSTNYSRMINHPNKKDKTGRSPLFRVTTTGNLNQVKELIANGADVNFRDNAGWTPLHLACLNGHTLIAKYLIDYGANVRAKGLDGDTPLHDSSANQHFDCIQLLINNNADVFAMNDHHQYPIDMISDTTMNIKIEGEKNSDRCKNILDYKMKQLDQLLFNHYGKGFNQSTLSSTKIKTTTPLHDGCKRNDIYLIKKILKDGCNINIKDDHGRTCLYEATKHGHVQLIQFLIDHGAIMSLQSKDGQTILHEACIYHQEEAVSIFINNGMDLFIKDHQGNIAYECTTYSPIRQLLIKAMDNQKETSLLSTSSTSKTPLGLLNSNIPMTRKRNKRNSSSFHPFFYNEQLQDHHDKFSFPYSTRLTREEKKIKDYIRVFNKLNKRKDSSTHQHDDHGYLRSKNSSKKKIKKKLSTQKIVSSKSMKENENQNDNNHPSSSSSYGSLKITSNTNINKKDNSGRTLLHQWARRGDINMVSTLINELGADLHMSDYAGWRPLHVASLHGHVDVVQLLLDHGADQQCQSLTGDSPLHDAVENQHLDVVQLLLNHGANPFLLNANNISPKMIAMNLPNNKDMMALFDQSNSFNVGPSKTPFVQPISSKQLSSSFTAKDPCQLNSSINNPKLNVCTSKKRRRLICGSHLSSPPLVINQNGSKKKRIKNASNPKETMEGQEDQHEYDADIYFDPDTRLKIEPMDDPPSLLPIPITISSSSSSSFSLSGQYITLSSHLNHSHFHHESRTPIPTPPPETWLEEKNHDHHSMNNNNNNSCLIKIEENEELNTIQPSSPSSTSSLLLFQPTLMTIQSYLPLYMTTLNNEKLWVIDYQVYLLLGGDLLTMNKKEDYFMNKYNHPWEKEKRLMTFNEKEQYWPYLEKRILYYYEQFNHDKELMKEKGEKHERKDLSAIQNHFLSHSFYFIPLEQAIASLRKDNYHHHCLLTSKLSTHWIPIKYAPTLPPKMAMKLKKLNKL